MTTPWIQNVAASQVAVGLHKFEEGNTVLIQIMDPGVPFPNPKETFLETHQFSFHDVETEDSEEYTPITQEQADEIFAILERALATGRNVVVHCYAGIYRSGAVVEVGTGLGFEDTGTYRCPNRLVLAKLRSE